MAYRTSEALASEEADPDHARKEPSGAPDATWRGLQGEWAVTDKVSCQKQGWCSRGFTPSQWVQNSVPRRPKPQSRLMASTYQYTMMHWRIPNFAAELGSQDLLLCKPTQTHDSDELCGGRHRNLRLPLAFGQSCGGLDIYVSHEIWESKSHFLGRISGGRCLAVIDIFEGHWEDAGRAGCLHQNIFLKEKDWKDRKMLDNVEQRKMSSSKTEIMRCGLF